MTYIALLLLEEFLHQCNCTLPHNPLNLNIDFLLSSAHKATARNGRNPARPRPKNNFEIRGVEGEVKMRRKDARVHGGAGFLHRRNYSNIKGNSNKIQDLIEIVYK